MNEINQTINNESYQTLGKKVFWLFFLQISPFAFILLLISIVLFVLSFQQFLATSLLGNIQNNILLASFIIFILSIFTFIGCSWLAWLTYKNYIFLMSENSFKIKRGIFNKTENAIPYHQIQNVDIERDLVFQMLGLSRVIILTAGHADEEPSTVDEAEGIIPAIDEKLAEWLQTELLKRANVQKVTETK